MSSKIRIGFVYSHPFQVHGAPHDVDELGRAILFPRDECVLFPRRISARVRATSTLSQDLLSALVSYSIVQSRVSTLSDKSEQPPDFV